jgi:hypothetical protein
MCRKLALTLPVACLILALTSCSKTVTIRAAIVYKMGGAEPLARVPFHLLNEDLETVLRNAGINPITYDGSVTPITEYGMTMRYRRVEPEKAARMESAIQPHIVKTAVTDFEGTAQFDDVPSGTYYIVGVAETRGGYAVWNLKVEVSGSKTVILDQNNAVYSR